MNKKHWYALALIVAIVIVAIPQTPVYAALVNCGKDAPCTLANFWGLLVGVVDFLLKFIGIPLAVLGIGVGGFYIIIGSNSEGDRTKGKEIIYASVIGLFIALAAWLIVNTVLTGLGVKENVVTNPLKKPI